MISVLRLIVFDATPDTRWSIRRWRSLIYGSRSSASSSPSPWWRCVGCYGDWRETPPRSTSPTSKENNISERIKKNYGALSTDLLSSCAQLSLPTMVSLALNSLQEATLLPYFPLSFPICSLSFPLYPLFLSSFSPLSLSPLSLFFPPSSSFVISFSSDRNANSLPQHSVDVGDRWLSPRSSHFVSLLLLDRLCWWTHCGETCDLDITNRKFGRIDIFTVDCLVVDWINQ